MFKRPDPNETLKNEIDREILGGVACDGRVGKLIDKAIDKHFEKLTEENRLLKDAFVWFIHESCHQLSYYRNSIPMLQRWLDKETFKDSSRVQRISSRLMDQLEKLCDYYAVARTILHPKKPPTNSELAKIIEDIKSGEVSQYRKKQ